MLVWLLTLLPFKIASPIEAEGAAPDWAPHLVFGEKSTAQPSWFACCWSWFRTLAGLPVTAVPIVFWMSVLT